MKYYEFNISISYLERMFFKFFQHTALSLKIAFSGKEYLSLIGYNMDIDISICVV